MVIDCACHSEATAPSMASCPPPPCGGARRVRPSYLRTSCRIFHDRSDLGQRLGHAGHDLKHIPLNTVDRGIPEICKAIRVSSWALQAYCHEHLGRGQSVISCCAACIWARRALRQTAPNTASVMEIATRYGFWQLRRFAVEYQSLFGESPSATLRRPPE